MYRNRMKSFTWGLVILTLLIFSGACSNSSLPEVQQNVVPEQHIQPSPTPFQPQPGVFDEPFVNGLPSLELSISPTPLPTIRVEGIYPTPITDSPTLVGNSPTFLVTRIDPLTGLPPADPALLERRPIAVKITNYPRYVRPQSGLTRADVVYEYYIEGGLTRFIAVFYGNDVESAGPVRSGRYFDAHITRMYHAFYVFKYADPREYTYFKNSDLVDFLVVPGYGACPPFFVGKKSVDTYNNIFFNTTKFRDCISRRDVDNSRPPIRSGFFYDLPLESDQAGELVYIRYSVDDYFYWEYNLDTNRYVRYQEKDSTRDGKRESYKLLTDALTGEPVGADNIIVLFVPHTFANIYEKEDEVYHIDLVDSGPAFVFLKGIFREGMWRRTNVDQPLLITDTIGSPIPLRPGITFYEVMGMSSKYWQDGDDWHFQFKTP